VRIVIEQIARILPEDRHKWWMDQVGAVSWESCFLIGMNADAELIQALKQHIQDRPELEWEHHIYETPKTLWRIQNIDAPPMDSQAEKDWKTQDKATPWVWVGEGADRTAVLESKL
jgi:hypothetical protein